MFSDCLRDALLIYEITDDEGAAGVIVRLDSLSMSVKWQAHIHGFNVGDPLMHNGFLYLTCIGEVGKLDVLTGKYIWKIENLYRSQGLYNSFDKPFFAPSSDKIVAFPENKSGLGSARTIPLQTLEVDDKTGTILRGAPPDKKQ